MLKNVMCLAGLLAVCGFCAGCAAADRNAKTVVDATYQSVMETDEWIKKNMW